MIAFKPHEKAMLTLKALMNLLGINFHFKKIQKTYKEIYTIECVVMLINRCIKMYQAVEHLCTIFKLISKSKTSGLSENIDDRLLTAIKTFLQDHTLFPVAFKYGGVD